MKHTVMNIDSPTFVPHAVVTAMATAEASGACVMSDELEPNSADNTPPTSPNALKSKYTNVSHWLCSANASKYYDGCIGNSYLHYLHQQQQEHRLRPHSHNHHNQQQQQQLHTQRQHFQYFVYQPGNFLNPNFHYQWTQMSAIVTAATIQPIHLQRQLLKQQIHTTAITRELSLIKTQQKNTKIQQKPQQQITLNKLTTNGRTKTKEVATITVMKEAITTTMAMNSVDDIVDKPQHNCTDVPAGNDNNNHNSSSVNSDNANGTTVATGDANRQTSRVEMVDNEELTVLSLLSPGNIVAAILPKQSSQIADKLAVPTKKSDKMQRNGSRFSQLMRNPKYFRQQQQQQQNSCNSGHTYQQHHNNGYHHQQNPQQNFKNDSSDSGISTNASHQCQHQHQQQHIQKQRKSRSNIKRPDNATISLPGGNANQKRSMNCAVDDWLSPDMVYWCDRRYTSSCAEDNMMACHNPAHRSSTSSEAAASDEINSSSSNEDLSAVYTVMAKSNKKAGKARKNRQQRQRKQLENRNAGNLLAIPMDIDEDSKENQRPVSNAVQQQQLPQKTASMSLRKQCTKAEALKAANKHNNSNSKHNNAKASKAANALTTSPSNSSVCSNFSSMSSSSSTSSAASTPTNSAHCSPTASPAASKRTADNFRKIARALAPPLRQQSKLHMPESELVQHLRRYVTNSNLLRVYGYPVESAIHEGCIEIYKCLPRPSVVHTHHSASKSAVVNTTDGLQLRYISATAGTQWTIADNLSGDLADSGQGSGDSSPPSMDSDSSEAGEDEPATTTACFTPDGSYQIFSQYDQSLEKQCVRCFRTFHVTELGEYLSHESCIFHWGKLHTLFTGNKGYTTQYTCCHGTKESEGCSRNRLHVWTGAVVGMNGPYTDFVYTRSRCEPNRPTKVYALDCEMSFTGRGLEATKVTVVGYDGQLVYEHFVRPEAEIVDYNTRFSGITEKDLCKHSNKSVKSLPEVQRDLLQLIDADTILIGHALDNDLRVLRIVHKTIIDTSIAFPHSSGFPYRRALKNLTKSCLNRDIQCGDAGHSSFEDSRACLELMLWKVRKELRQDGQYE